ncbi:hypothetical protein BFW01_g12707 [Lasiodiplodia theobromae]|nr:hypothetical protein BFW01_g12707 [Lasiodiplodia theobromae]
MLHTIQHGLLLLLLSLVSLSVSLEKPHSFDHKPIHIQSHGIQSAAQEFDRQVTILVHHITIVTVVALPVISEHSGRIQEETRLEKALQKSNGKWSPDHPRYRLLNALKGYLLYKPRAIADVDKWRKAYKKIPRKQRAFIEANIHYSKKLNTIEHLINTNAELTHAIVDNALAFYNISRRELDDFIAETKDRDTASDAASSKTHVQQALKHFVRDWSADGRHERDPVFPCILHALKQEFVPETREDRAASNATTEPPIRVLVPGAGLGRLAHEIAALGHFEVTTNEWSAYTNVAYRFLTTLLRPPPQSPTTITFHPFIDWLSHQRTTTSLTRPITIPDFLPPVPPPYPPSPPSPQSQVLLIEADFTTLTGTYDALITLFFIDTAANLLAYFHSIHALLRPGGVWVNAGPLLWGTGARLQLSLDEVVALAEGVGFEFVERRDEEGLCGEDVEGEGMGMGKVRGREVPYGFDERALSRNAYLAVNWVARKKG